MAGYRVHAIDFPAHSLSGGRTTNPYEMSEVLAHFIEDLGLLNAIITHYLGEPVAVLALRDPPVANKVICISAPSSGPGHRRILRDPQVIEKIRTFIPS